MIVYMKCSDTELETPLSPIEYASLADIQQRGDAHVSIAVSKGERCGYIPLIDVDHARTMAALNNPDQLPLVLL